VEKITIRIARERSRVIAYGRVAHGMGRTTFRNAGQKKCSNSAFQIETVLLEDDRIRRFVKNE